MFLNKRVRWAVEEWKSKVLVTRALLRWGWRLERKVCVTKRRVECWLDWSTGTVGEVESWRPLRNWSVLLGGPEEQSTAHKRDRQGNTGRRSTQSWSWVGVKVGVENRNREQGTELRELKGMLCEGTRHATWPLTGTTVQCDNRNKNMERAVPLLLLYSKHTLSTWGCSIATAS